MSGIRFELELSDGSFVQRVIRAGDSVEGLNKTLKSTVVSMSEVSNSSATAMKTIRDLTVAYAALHTTIAVGATIFKNWLGGIISVNSNIERSTILLKSMSTAVDPVKEATQAIADLRKEAREAPYSLQALSEVFVQMKSTGASGFRELVDGVAAFGGNEEVLKRAGLAIQQMSGKGVIQMEELRQQLGEAMPRATELMARSMGRSYGEFIKLVSTGTVSAKEAIESLAGELDRVYGGEAARQTNTFNGLITKTKSLFQDLAISAGTVGDGGKLSFYDEVKNQLRDLNDTLSQSYSTRLAEQVGQTLASVMRGFREVIDVAITFRNEILAVGEVMLASFLFTRSISALKGIATSFAEARAGVAALRAEITLMDWSKVAAGGNVIGSVGSALGSGMMKDTSQAFATIGSWIASTFVTAPIAKFTGAVSGASTAVISMASGTRLAATASSLLSGAVTLLSGGVALLTNGVRILALTVTTFLPWLPLLAVAVSMVAEYFDVFGSKAKNAWTELKTFNAVTRENIELLEKSLAAEKESIAAQEESIDRRRKAYGRMTIFGMNSGANSASNNEAFDRQNAKELTDLAARKAKYQEDEGLLAAGKTKLEEEESKKASDAKLRILDDQVAATQRSYDKQRNEQQKFHDDEIRRLSASKETQTRETARYDQETRDTELALYQSRIDTVQTFYNSQIAIAARATGVDKTAAEQAAAEALRIKQKNIEDQNKLKALPLGVTMTSKGADEDKLYDKGQKRLVDLQSDIEKMTVELNGGSGAAAKLRYEIEHAKFGPESAQRVKELKDQLLKAATEYDALEGALRGKRQLDNLNSESEDLRAKLAGLNGEAAKFAYLIAAGKFGPANTAEVQRLAAQLKKAADENDRLKKLFEGMTKVRDVRAEVDGLIAALEGGSKAAEKIQYLFESGKFGRVTDSGVQKMVSDLKEAVTLKEKLDLLMKGKSEFDNDYQSVLEEIAKGNIDAATDGMKEYGKVAEMTAKLATNGYHGYGTEEMTTTIGQAKSMLEEAKKKSEEAGSALAAAGSDGANAFVTLNDAMAGTSNLFDKIVPKASTLGALFRAIGASITDGAFGQTTISRGNSFLDTLTSIANVFDRLRSTVSGLSLGGPFSALPGLGALSGLGSQIGSAMSGFGQLIGQLKDVREKFATELQNPAVLNKLYAMTNAEVGGQGPEAAQAFMETIFNRAAASGGSIDGVLSNRKYFPAETFINASAVEGSPDLAKKFEAVLRQVLAGSNLSYFATGNESGDVHSGGARVTYGSQGERFVWENAYTKWSQMMETAARDVTSVATGVTKTTAGVSSNGTAVASGVEIPVKFKLPDDLEKKVGPEMARQFNASLSNITNKDVADKYISAISKRYEANGVAGVREIAKEIKEAEAEIADLSEKGIKASTRLEQERKRIREGKVDVTNKDPDSEQYKSLLAIMDLLDKKKEEYAKKDKDRKKGEAAAEQMDQRSKDVIEKFDSSLTKFNNPDLTADSEKYLQLQRQLRKELEAVGVAYGTTSDQYKAAKAAADTVLSGERNAEILSSFAAIKQKTDKLREATMTESEIRQQEYDKEKKRIDDEVEKFSGSAEQRKDVEASAQAYLSALRQKNALDQSPTQKMFLQWKDMGKNFSEASAHWLDGAVDSMADFMVTGKANWQSLFQSVAKDAVKIAMRGVIAQLGNKDSNGTGSLLSKGGAASGASSGGKGGAASGASSGGKGGGKGGFNILKIFGMAHTGGMGGSMGLLSQAASVANFAGAPRFHTGGMLNTLAGLSTLSGLKSNERPIIVEDSEGIFTTKQMSALASIIAGDDPSAHRDTFTGDQKVVLGLTSGLTGGRSTSSGSDTGGTLGNALRSALSGSIPKFHTGGVPGAISAFDVSSAASAASAANAKGVTAQVNSASQNVTVAPTINLTSHGGTPEQNADLAGQVSKQVTESMRALVVGELTNQMRHGGVLAKAMGK